MTGDPLHTLEHARKRFARLSWAPWGDVTRIKACVATWLVLTCETHPTRRKCAKASCRRYTGRRCPVAVLRTARHGKRVERWLAPGVGPWWGSPCRPFASGKIVDLCRKSRDVCEEK